jgi:hypothetical protein
MMMVGGTQMRFHGLGWMNSARTLGHLRCFWMAALHSMGDGSLADRTPCEAE